MSMPKLLSHSSKCSSRRPDRLEHLLESLDDFGMLIYLGASNPLTDGQKDKAKGYAPGAQTEFDLGCSAFETLLGARIVSRDSTVRKDDVWAWQEYEFEWKGVTRTAFALNTPKEVHEDDQQSHRANTYDNCKFFARMAELADNPHVTAVFDTNALYLPGQHLAAVQELTLRYGVAVETVGPSAERTGADRIPPQLLQENKAGIDAAVRLEQAIAEAEAELKASRQAAET